MLISFDAERRQWRWLFVMLCRGVSRRLCVLVWRLKYCEMRYAMRHCSTHRRDSKCVLAGWHNKCNVDCDPTPMCQRAASDVQRKHMQSDNCIIMYGTRRHMGCDGWQPKTFALSKAANGMARPCAPPSKALRLARREWHSGPLSLLLLLWLQAFWVHEICFTLRGMCVSGI